MRRIKGAGRQDADNMESGDFMEIGTGQRDPERIRLMLGKLEEAWKIYPDMRLGQLVAVCAGSENIFGIEDDIMLERIQLYINSMEEKR